MPGSRQMWHQVNHFSRRIWRKQQLRFKQQVKRSIKPDSD